MRTPESGERPAGSTSGVAGDDRRWLSAYLESYRAAIRVPDVEGDLVRLKELLVATHRAGRKVILAGNGGSAATASHCAVDFTKTAGVRCITFNDADLITCFANDYGYERWVEKAIEFYVDDGDVVVLISASGRSPNMVLAARYARKRGVPVVTFTGFSPENELRSYGDLNFWVDSDTYNVVEMTHQIWLLAVCDLIRDGVARPTAPPGSRPSGEP